MVITTKALKKFSAYRPKFNKFNKINSMSTLAISLPKQRIFKYHQTGEYREDVADFKEGGVYEHLCVFCGCRHEDFYPVMPQEGGIVHFCESCLTLYNEFSMDQALNMAKEDDPLIDAWLRDMSEPTAHRIFLPPRLVDYLDKQGLDREHALNFCKSNAVHNTCYFCSGSLDVDDHVDGSMVLIPVGEDDMGGIVFICAGCAGAIGSQGKVTTVHYHTAHLDTCCDDGSEYPLTQAEWEGRRKAGTLGKHFCPQCINNSYWQDISNESSPLGGRMAFATRVNPFAIKRFVEKSCSGCDSSRFYDRTIGRYKLEIHDQIIKGTSPFICEACLEEESMTNRYINIVKVPSDNFLYFAGIKLYKDVIGHTKFGFVCYKASIPGKYLNSRKVMSLNAFESAYEATLEAIDQLDMLYNGIFKRKDDE